MTKPIPENGLTFFDFQTEACSEHSWCGPTASWFIKMWVESHQLQPSIARLCTFDLRSARQSNLLYPRLQARCSDVSRYEFPRRCFWAMASQKYATENDGTPSSIFDLALQSPHDSSADAHALAALFDISSGAATCRVSPLLGEKYGTATCWTSTDFLETCKYTEPI